MSETVPTLADLQSQFQDGVLNGDDRVLARLLHGPRAERETLFGVYRNAYVGRLADVVRADHPLLAAYMGDDAFTAMAFAYIAAHPSRSRNARWVSHALPEFLVTHEPAARSPELAELAAIERAVSDCFDAPDAPVLKLAELSDVAPGAWTGLILTPHPAAKRLDMHRNAFAIWSALQSGADAPPVETLPEPQRLLIWRRDTKPSVRALTYEEAMLWDEAAKGTPFAALCELAAVYDDPSTAAHRVAVILSGWLDSGALASPFRIAAPQPSADAS